MNSKYPTLPVVFVTGYADNAALEKIGDARIIKKPFVGDELVTKVQAALAKRGHRPGGKVVALSRRYRSQDVLLASANKVRRVCCGA